MFRLVCILMLLAMVSACGDASLDGSSSSSSDASSSMSSSSSSAISSSSISSPSSISSSASSSNSSNGPGGFTIAGDERGLCRVDGGFEDIHTGFSGKEYIKTDSAVGAGITWSISSPQLGFFDIEFRYANGSNSDLGTLLMVDGQVVAHLRFAPTGGWDQWDLAMEQVSLEAGNNRLELVATNPGGVAYIDYLRIEANNVTAGDCVSASSVGEQIWRGEYRQGLPGCNLCHAQVSPTSVEQLRNIFNRSRSMQAFRSLTDEELRSVVDYLLEL